MELGDYQDPPGTKYRLRIECSLQIYYITPYVKNDRLHLGPYILEQGTYPDISTRDGMYSLKQILWERMTERCSKAQWDLQIPQQILISVERVN